MPGRESRRVMENTSEIAVAEFRKSMEVLRKRPLTVRWRKWRGKRVAIINDKGGKINSKPVKSPRGPCRHYQWTEEDEELVRKHYIQCRKPAREVRKLLSQPHTPNAIRKKASKLREGEEENETAGY